MKFITRLTAGLVAASLGFSGMAQASQGLLIGTEQVAASQGVHSATAQREMLQTTLMRADVAAGLEARGVSVEQARERIAALTDDEVATVAQTVDSAPAGSGVVGVLFTVFVVLLVTDILGLTKVFPFTRSVR